MARPKVEVDETQLKALMRLKPTLADTAAFFGVSEDTIDRRCKEFSGVSFAEFREQNMVHTRLELQRSALKQANSGNTTMLIFCLKNLCGWRDKQPGEEDRTLTLQGGDKPVEVKNPDIEERIMQLKESND